jgi:16S rRNA (cytosine1402-N4)-methyltransferase
MHRPVMLKEVLAWLQPRAGGAYLDGTVGEGGHSRAILEASAPDGRVIGLDRDAAALTVAEQQLSPFGGRVTLAQADYLEAARMVGGMAIAGLHGAVLDLGVSSAQFDSPERGFSFMAEGPLDMRMDSREACTAADLVNRLPENELARILFEYGEERYGRRIARAIVRRRERAPILTTLALVDVVRGAVPAAYRHGRLHCATRTFQALRIAVNRELERLGLALRALAGLLLPGGRLVVLSFHSLEDRIVKRTFRELGAGATAGYAVLTKRAITPSDDECVENPRARSAKLRVLARKERAA